MTDTGSFEEWMRSWGAADRTVSDRTTIVSAGLRQWGPPEQVTLDTLTSWLASPEFSAWTRVTYFYHLRSYFGWLTSTGQIDVDPSVGLRTPRTPKGKPRPLTQAEVTLVLSEATSARLKAWLLIGFLSGLRAHEMAKLRGEEINEESLFVVGKGNQAAMIPTHPDLWDLAQEFPRRGFWFPARDVRNTTGHVNGRSISTLVTRHFARLGVEGSIHRCRHTYCTALLRSGANVRVVQTLMRHESLATTAGYAAVDEAERLAAVQQLRVSWVA